MLVMASVSLLQLFRANTGVNDVNGFRGYPVAF